MKKINKHTKKQIGAIILLLVGVEIFITLIGIFCGVIPITIAVISEIALTFSVANVFLGVFTVANSLCANYFWDLENKKSEEKKAAQQAKDNERNQ